MDLHSFISAAIHRLPALAVALIIHALFSAEPLALDSLPVVMRREQLPATSARWAAQVTHIENFSSQISPVNRLGFKNSSQFGIFDASGSLLIQGETDGFEAVGTDAAVVRIPADASLELKTSSASRGKVLSSMGYPFFIDSRLFVLRSDQSGLVEYDLRGTQVWEREYPSILTCIAARRDLLLTGSLDGSALLMNRSGQTFFSFEQDTTKAACVYGVALAADERRFAVITGIEPQQLIVFQRYRSGFREMRRFTLESELRRQTACTFVDNDSRLIVERATGVSILDLVDGSSEFRSTGKLQSPFLDVGAHHSAFFLEMVSGVYWLSCVGSRGRVVAHTTLFSRDVWLNGASAGPVLTDADSVMLWTLELR